MGRLCVASACRKFLLIKNKGKKGVDAGPLKETVYNLHLRSGENTSGRAVRPEYEHLFFCSKALRQSNCKQISEENWALRLKFMLFLHNKVFKTTRGAIFYTVLQNHGDYGKDRYCTVVFGQSNIIFLCKGMKRDFFHLSGRILLVKLLIKMIKRGRKTWGLELAGVRTTALLAVLSIRNSTMDIVWPQWPNVQGRTFLSLS